MKKNLQKKITSIVLGLLISQLSYSQNFANNWVLGDFGLEFKNNAVRIIHGYSSHLYEGFGIISDKQGNLLFYSDGLNVWDKNNGLMPNGGDVFSSTAGTLIKESLVVPKPGSGSLYYLFTVDPHNGNEGSGLYFSIVDMSLNNGLGDVILKGKKIMSTVSNKITAVYHSNNHDVWLITHLFNSNNYFSYLITASGLVETPVVSSVGHSITSSFDGQ
jgi:hypothetical protein